MKEGCSGTLAQLGRTVELWGAAWQDSGTLGRSLAGQWNSGAAWQDSGTLAQLGRTVELWYSLEDGVELLCTLARQVEARQYDSGMA